MKKFKIFSFFIFFLIVSCGKKEDLTVSLVDEMKVKDVGEKYAVEYEKEALKVFEEYYKRFGQIRPYYVQKIKEKDGKYYYRYYKPIIVKPLCLICHGNPKDMDPQIYSIIRKKYPEDKAVGYKVGDLRGVVRVSIPVKVIDKL